MRRFTERLQKIERQRRPTPGGLPIIIAVPANGPDRAQVLADVARRRALGEPVFAIADGENNPLMAYGLMEWLA